MSGSALRASWLRTAMAVAMAWALIVWVYQDAALGIVQVWERSNSYAHGWFVPPLALWLMWRQRHHACALPPSPAWSGLAVLGLGVAMWLVGELMTVNAATHFGLVTMLIGVVPALTGWTATSAWVFPLCFLYLGVPFGDFLLPQLMDWTADFTVLAVRMTGIPVYREGLHFVIPSGSWSVAEACSGIRYLVASIMAGSLYGYLYYNSLRLRVRFLVLAVFVSLAANWLRAYIIVLLGHFSGNTIATGVDHLIYGWFFFAAVLVLLFWLGGRWHDDPPVKSAPEVPAQPASPASLRWGPVVAMLIATVAVGVSGRESVQLMRHSVAQAEVKLQTWSPQDGWQEVPPAEAWAPAYLQPDAQLHNAYQSVDGKVVGVFVHYFRRQDASHKLVSSSQMLVDEKNESWLLVKEPLAQLDDASGKWQAVQALVRRRGSTMSATEGQGLRAWQFYWVDGRWEGRPALAKLHGAMQLLQGHGDDGAIITLYTADVGGARALLERFMKTQGDAMKKALASTARQD